MPPLTRLALALLLAPLCASCSDVSGVNVKLAPGFVPNRAPVSVLGVFKDGRMSTEAWIPIGPPLATAFGLVGDVCETAYNERLQAEKPELYTFIEEDTRNNGITEEMLAKLAPQADGELILAITVHGRIIQAAAKDDEMPPQSAGPMRPGAAGPGGPGLGRGRPGARQVPGRSTAPGGLEFTASLYSVQKQKSVARLSFAYTGTSVEDAFRHFAAEVGSIVPGSTCKGWHWKDRGTPGDKPPGAGTL